MIELGYIDKNDLIFENKPLKDRINTKLTLLDTDWMTYELEASFRTKTQGELNVRFPCQFRKGRKSDSGCGGSG